ncbi:MAG: N-acetyltransferase [Paenibacillus sp.]|jgi:predicted GNAT family acetyltransferase|nr:N-acetyltransferase [Paenibacillus sp.]
MNERHDNHEIAATLHNTEQTQQEIVIEKEGNGYIVRGISGKVGEITYELMDVDTWAIDHTYLDSRYRGNNLARQLLDLVVADARAAGVKIIPSCSYVLAQFKRNPEYADVWKNATR